MSQPKSERKYSHFEVLNSAKHIRNETVALVLRDFGVKSRKRSPKFFAHVYDMEDDDVETFVGLMEKYGIEEIVDQYPEWFIALLRERMISDVFQLVEYIEFSNVYPTTVQECNFRRQYQNQAISKLFDLYQWLELAGTCLPIDLESLNPYFEKIEKEINAIKSLRKYDNRVRKRIQRKEKDLFAKGMNELTTTAQSKDIETFIDKAFDFMAHIGRYV